MVEISESYRGEVLQDAANWLVGLMRRADSVADISMQKLSVIGPDRAIIVPLDVHEQQSPEVRKLREIRGLLDQVSVAVAELSEM